MYSSDSDSRTGKKVGKTRSVGVRDGLEGGRGPTAFDLGSRNGRRVPGWYLRFAADAQGERRYTTCYCTVFYVTARWSWRAGTVTNQRTGY